MLAKIALLNLVKHPKRSVLVVAVVALSVIAMVLVGGFMDGAKGRFFDTLFEESGHLQIHENGFADRIDPLSLAYTIDRPEEMVRRLANDPRALAVEKVLPFGTKMICKDRNCFIFGYGLEPDTSFFRKVRNGTAEGSFLPAGRGIAVSRRIAGLLGCGLHDEVSLLVAWEDGTPYYLTFEITGVFKTDSTEFDDNYIFISHDNALELVALPGKTVEIRVTLADPGLAEEFRSTYENYFLSEGVVAETWRETFGSFVTLLEFFDFFLIFMNLFVVIVAATVIINTVLMSVFERVRDFGTLRAIGLKKRHIFLLIASEGLVAGCFGSLIGFLLALPAGLLLEASGGISGGEFAESVQLGGSYPFSLSFPNLVLAFVFGVLVAVVGSVYAGFVNTKMKLPETLRYN